MKLKNLATSLTVLTTLFVGTPGARAADEPPIIKVTAAPSDAPADGPKQSLEVTATEISNPDNVEPTIRWIERDLAQAQAENPSIKPEVVETVTGDSGHIEARESAATVGGDGKGSLRRVVRDLLDKHYRVSFTIARGMANATSITWGIMYSSHVGIAQALTVGLVGGSMSMGLQYFNKAFQAWQNKPKSPVGRLGRGAFSNIIYMTVARFTSMVAAIPQKEHSFAAAATATVEGALLGSIAQVPWSMASAENAKIENEKHPENALSNNRTNDLTTLTASMVSTGLSVASILGAPLTNAAMLVMGAAGGIYYKYVMVKAKRWAKTKAEQEGLACEANAKGSL